MLPSVWRAIRLRLPVSSRTPLPAVAAAVGCWLSAHLCIAAFTIRVILPARTATTPIAPPLSIRLHVLHVSVAAVADMARCCSTSCLWLHIHQVVCCTLVDRLGESDGLRKAFLLVHLSLGGIEDVRYAQAS